MSAETLLVNFLTMPDQLHTAGAVFLSYASEDADAAARICEALRAAGVEVWFDRSELRGGDAWDLQIKKQARTRHRAAAFPPGQLEKRGPVSLAAI